MMSSQPISISIILIVLVCATMLRASDAKITEVKRESPLPTAPDVPLPKIKPMAFKDAKTGILAYFESDGLTAAAIDNDGKVLWHKNPAEKTAVRGFTPSAKSWREALRDVTQLWPAPSYCRHLVLSISPDPLWKAMESIWGCSIIDHPLAQLLLTQRVGT
jgi:hypothetical protein